MSGAGKTMSAILLLIRAIATRRQRVHHRPRRALRVPRLADPRRRIRADRRRGPRHQLLGRARTPHGSRRRRSTICSRCTRCCSASTTPPGTPTGSHDLESEPARPRDRRGVRALRPDRRGTPRAAAARGARAPLPPRTPRRLGRDRRGAAQPLDAHQQLPATTGPTDTSPTGRPRSEPTHRWSSSTRA